MITIPSEKRLQRLNVRAGLATQTIPFGSNSLGMNATMKQISILLKQDTLSLIPVDLALLTHFIIRRRDQQTRNSLIYTLM
jgi:hypothetical protein